MTSLATPSELGYDNQRYNLVFIPKNPNVHYAAIDHAKQMNRFSDGYQLQEWGGVPHVTLCQFHMPEGANKIAIVRDIFKAVAQDLGEMKKIELVFGQDFLEAGRNNSSDCGYWWVAQHVSGPLLAEAQKAAYNRITRYVHASDAPKQFSPRLSFSRLVGSAENLIVTPLPEALKPGVSAEFVLALGRSTENGQLKDVLATVDKSAVHPIRQLPPVAASAHNAWYAL